MEIPTLDGNQWVILTFFLCHGGNVAFGLPDMQLVADHVGSTGSGVG
jgi:hypothetical protein